MAACLQEEISGMKVAEAQREKLVGDVVRENRALVGPLGKVSASGKDLLLVLACDRQQQTLNLDVAVQ
jgi:hypothetical protein